MINHNNTWSQEYYRLIQLEVAGQLMEIYTRIKHLKAVLDVMY